MSDAETLFPGPLAPCYDAFVTAVRREGSATREFKKTQASYAVDRKFAWLVPLTKTRCLLLLDMYEEHPDPSWRDVIAYRPDKYTHQAEISSPEVIERLSAAGHFRHAHHWGAKGGL